jgi:hypothetical protein
VLLKTGIRAGGMNLGHRFRRDALSQTVQSRKNHRTGIIGADLSSKLNV